MTNTQTFQDPLLQAQGSKSAVWDSLKKVFIATITFSCVFGVILAITHFVPSADDAKVDSNDINLTTYYPTRDDIRNRVVTLMNKEHRFFNFLDSDGDGSLSLNELKYQWSKQGIEKTEDELMEMIDAAEIAAADVEDYDGMIDGEISWKSEFDMYEPNFCKSYDPDDDGEITAEELAESLSDFGFTEDELEDLMLGASPGNGGEFIETEQCGMLVFGLRKKTICTDYDADKDGSVTEQELSKAMAEMDNDLNLIEIAEMISAADEDKDEVLSGEECNTLVHFLTENPPHKRSHKKHTAESPDDSHADQEYKDWFDEFDTNKNQCLSLDEFTFLLEDINFEFDRVATTEAVYSVDINGDWCVEYGEFTRWVYNLVEY
eukprot:GFYU01016874.1.p1 GENE.GFYU01016874.1~~GFYU01016874.1.p1  ORF type:complete len:377 (+),score=140.11 GFYU01016874.1:143-1273(+)